MHVVCCQLSRRQLVLHLSFETQAVGMSEGGGRGAVPPSPPNFCRLVDPTYLHREGWADYAHQLLHAPAPKIFKHSDIPEAEGPVQNPV